MSYHLDRFFSKVFRPLTSWLLMIIILFIFLMSLIKPAFLTNDVFYIFLPTMLAAVLSLQIICWFIKQKDKLVSIFVVPLIILFVVFLILNRYYTAISLYVLLLIVTSKKYIDLVKFNFK